MNWQPIETAPKDGTEILIFCEDDHWAIDIVKWEQFGNDFYWARARCVDGLHINEKATHWMPLPALPDADYAKNREAKLKRISKLMGWG